MSQLPGANILVSLPPTPMCKNMPVFGIAQESRHSDGPSQMLVDPQI
jgi:hypothetical protein